MVRENKAAWKANYFLKVVQLFDKFQKRFIVGADNVGSRQMQNIRISLRGKGVVLMGRNTMIPKAIRGHLENNGQLEKLLPHIKNIVGFVFTKNDLCKIRDKLMQSKALSIPTKISKDAIEIINDVPILKPGYKVGASEATLLKMLNISPFSYGLIIKQAYDSTSIFSPEILDINPEDLRVKFQTGVANLAAVCLQVGYPTIASVPHSVANGFSNLLAIAATTDVEFKEATTIKKFHKDSCKFAAVAAPVAAKAAPVAAAMEAIKEESEEEEDDDMVIGLFD